MTREFFNVVKEKPPRTTITELTNPSGAALTKHKDIEDACLSFYKELYSAPPKDMHSRHAGQEILAAILECITPLMALALQQPLSELELHRAACSLSKEKAPGPDGIAVNFFTIY